ncbi:MAG: hypothetical protein NC117_08580 [Pseudoflavonifractor sp.]|nr:hypothetical protein [Pseudoflavonifractor sp.]
MKRPNSPSLLLSLVPVAGLILSLAGVIVTRGADSVQTASYVILPSAALLATVLTLTMTSRRPRAIGIGLIKSARQILPALPVLLLIGGVSTTWMLSGVVPTMIDYGLAMISPPVFLFVTCAVCAVISVLTGSSWTTIATIGVAFMGIGSVMGYSEAWIAGAVISGAYFGDKCSPLSDTTVLASTTCGVDLFAHIKYLMYTTVPAMTIALTVFAAVGLSLTPADTYASTGLVERLHATFNITPLVLVIPALTLTLIALRVNTLVTLSVSTLSGVAGMFVFQPGLFEAIDPSASTVSSRIAIAAHALLTDTAVSTGHPRLDELVSTGGIGGMLPTVYLVLGAMTFGGAMMGTGMLATTTGAITSRLRSAKSTVAATVGSGLMLNSCTADQYLSIIIGGNIYKNVYRRNGLEGRLLSRSLEDSVSVTSVLIPWNSCGITQSTVLGVPTLSYLPCCIFNLLSPIMSVTVAWLGLRIRHLSRPTPAVAGAVR